MRFKRTDESSRLARRNARKTGRRFRSWLLVVLAIAGIALVVAGGMAVAASRGASSRALAAEKVAVAPQTISTPGTAGAASARMIEVPSLMGLGIDEARVVLESAGLVVSVREAGAPSAAGDKRTVASQDPLAGTVVEMGDTVRLVVPLAAPAVSSKSLAAATKPSSQRFVVCIDPGHQARANSTPEPIGPGAAQTKPSVSGGATGVSTGIPEYEIALQIAMNLKKRLEAAGIKVVMTRTVSDVDIPNSKRAEIANKSGADLFVRIHGDGSPKSSTVGISTLYPASNQWTKPIAAESLRAAEAVQSALIRSTGAVDRGAIRRSDLSGFNWAKVPSVLVEAGFLSNPVEDKLLASPHYQDKLAEGISQGVRTYLDAKAR